VASEVDLKLNHYHGSVLDEKICWVILVRCDALSKESAMPADDTVPACAISFVYPDPCKKILYNVHITISK